MPLNIALRRAPSELCTEIQVGARGGRGNGVYNKSIIKQNGQCDMHKYFTNFGSML